MSLAQLPLLSALTEKMRWHQARQAVLAENIANAETPGYVGRELEAFSYADHMSRLSVATVSTSATRPGHLVASVSSASGGGFSTSVARGFETTPEGNSVTLEDQMMKVTGNQMDYQAVTTLYTRSLKLIRTALGRSA